MKHCLLCQEAFTNSWGFDRHQCSSLLGQPLPKKHGFWTPSILVLVLLPMVLVIGLTMPALDAIDARLPLIALTGGFFITGTLLLLVKADQSQPTWLDALHPVHPRRQALAFYLLATLVITLLVAGAAR